MGVLMADRAPLYGLVLAGGESRRMGADKGDLRYHGVSQRAHLAGLLGRLCEAVFVSCRPDQASRVEPELSCLLDPAPGLGPLAGHLAAFRHRPDAAWLVVACDLPGLDAEALAALVSGRGPDWDAVAFRGSDDRPEPMAALWEPVMGERIAEAVALGRLSPRDLLREARCHLLDPPGAQTLLNANTPDDAPPHGV